MNTANFCVQCGSRLELNAQFCPKCGAKTATAAIQSKRQQFTSIHTE